jgi:hypothetical protein
MPNKPIPQGYKIFALADHGYIYAFTPSSRSKSLVEVVKHKDLTMTGSMVLGLLKHLPLLHKHYVIYLDNYFTSIGLFQILRDQGIGACGTTRTNKNDFPPLIRQLKERGIKTPWNTLCAIPKNGVLCFLWQDNNIVTGLSTIHTVDKTADLIERERKRPSKTSTSAAIARAPFGDSVKKKLHIPVLIDDYNHYMGAVDIANQLRAEYVTHKPTFRSWWPLFYWILDAAVVNAYRISCISRQEQKLPILKQLEFRKVLYQQLFEYVNDCPRPSMARPYKRKMTEFNFPESRLDKSLSHTLIQLPPKKRPSCTWCHFTKNRRVKDAEGSLRVLQTNWQCSDCKIPLCHPRTGRLCSKEFHSHLS